MLGVPSLHAPAVCDRPQVPCVLRGLGETAQGNADRGSEGLSLYRRVLFYILRQRGKLLSKHFIVNSFNFFTLRSWEILN